MNGKVRFLPCQTDLKMWDSAKREITGDTGLIPECDFPVGSEHTDTLVLHTIHRIGIHSLS